MVKFLIKDKLEEKGLSISDFAEKCGISLTSAYKYQNMQSISLDTLGMIAKCLGCSIKSLFLEEGEEPGDKMFAWTDEKEREMRVLLRGFESIVSDMNDLKERSKALLNDSVL